MMKRVFISFLVAMLLGLNAFSATPRPDEGMWLPMFVERLNWVDIQKMGLQLTPEELYSINHSSLKDAVVGLADGSAPNGYFCTGEIVSDQGLLFTNHHCGYDRIQKHSTIEHDYLTDGFWAMSKKEELPNPGLTASFLVRMEDLTDVVMNALSDTMNAEQKRAAVRKATKDIKEKASEDGKYDVVVKSFYEGNEYYMFVYETYKDVRLVGAPPSSIGKFGGDTDNWMWPRHTGDFSIFRVYTAPDGSPAEYSEENIPLKPRHHLPISLKGYKKGDYAMVWGYPGSTQRYLTSYGIEYALDKFNPTIVDVFGTTLDVMKTYMDADDAMRIKYASDYAGKANTWKYFIGQTKGLRDLKVKAKKQKIEEGLMAWVDQNPQRKEKYGNMLETIRGGYEEMQNDVVPFYYAAIGSGNIQMLGMVRQVNQLSSMLEDQKENEAAIEETTAALKESAANFFEDYDYDLDKDMLAAMLTLYRDHNLADQLPEIFGTINKKYKGDINDYTDNLYEKTMFANKDDMMKFLDKPKLKTLEKDPGYQMYQAFFNSIMQHRNAIAQGQEAVDNGMHLFVQALRDMNPDKKYYPDANSTMRFTYGTVEDYYPADAIHYDYVTHLYGVMEKEDPDNPEFFVPEKLKELFEAKDYGQYGVDGKLITCFLTTDDITGGNSGSPVINGNGELIGLAFDGNWEAMSGDIAFEKKLQRTINVDIRYVLFIIDKYAGAHNLIEELTLVK